jgi:hypothetical protein
MKNLKFLFSAIVLIIVFTQVKAQNITTSAALNNVLVTYYRVKNSLVADDAAVAQNKAKELIAAINAVEPNELTTAQKKTWTAHADKLLADSKRIAENNLEGQRDNFTTLSKDMFEVFKSLKINSATIYQQYCPMKKAIWLSETPDIKNPYFGEQMLSCGSTTETIAVDTK